MRKFVKAPKYLVLGMGFLLATHALGETKGTLKLNAPVSLSGETLKAGEYKLEWDDSGPNVELSIMRGKNVVAKIPARLVGLGEPADYNAAVTVKNESGPNTLVEIRFKGKKIMLQIIQPNDNGKTK